MGKYLKLFNTENEYKEYYEDVNEFISPCVSLCLNEQKLYFDNENYIKDNDYEAKTFIGKDGLTYNELDLELPSRTIWLDRNIGAKEINDEGKLYTFTKEYNSINEDIAFNEIGNDWRMPTYKELKELFTELSYRQIYSEKDLSCSFTTFISNFTLPTTNKRTIKDSTKGYGKIEESYIPNTGSYSLLNNAVMWLTRNGKGYTFDLVKYDKFKRPYFQFDHVNFNSFSFTKDQKFNIRAVRRKKRDIY